MQPVYFAHGYRKREAAFAAYFASLLRQKALLPSLDPPSNTVNSAKLERHLGYTKGLIAVIADRDGEVSPHILYEISMCIRSGQPLMVFMEDTVANGVLPRQVLHQRFSARSYIRETREHLHALEIFQTFIGTEHTPRFRSSTEMRSCLLIGLSSLHREYAAAVRALVSQKRYECVELPRGRLRLPAASNQQAAVRSASLAVCVLDDKTPSSVYFLGAARACLTPTIILSTEPNYPLLQAVPEEYQRRVISRDDADEGLRTLGEQIELFEEDFVELGREGKAEEYAHLLLASASTSGEYSHETRTTIIQELTMGDKYSAGQVGAQGPGAHAHDMTFNQIWNQSQNNIDLATLASELAVLRNHLRQVAQSPTEDAAVGALGQAEIAASEGNGPRALEALSKAGKWAFDNAAKIGVGVATAALKVALGL